MIKICFAIQNVSLNDRQSEIPNVLSVWRLTCFDLVACRASAVFLICYFFLKLALLWKAAACEELSSGFGCELMALRHLSADSQKADMITHIRDFLSLNSLHIK